MDESPLPYRARVSSPRSRRRSRFSRMSWSPPGRSVQCLATAPLQPEEGQPPQPAGPPRDPLWGLTAAEYEDVTTSAVDKLKKAGLFGEDGIFAEEFPQLAKEAAFLAITYPQVVQANKMVDARLIQLERDFKTYRIDKPRSTTSNRASSRHATGSPQREA